jgi:acyl transferase domain-containing protein
VKSNVGHLEGGSGLAGMLKSILILEKGIIPPNALFEKLNPKLRAERNNIQVSQLLSIVSIYLLNIKGS